MQSSLDEDADNDFHTLCQETINVILLVIYSLIFVSSLSRIFKFELIIE